MTMGEDFKPGDRVRVVGYDHPGERATKVDGAEGTVREADYEDSSYVSVELDGESLTKLVKVWLFKTGELVKL